MLNALISAAAILAGEIMFAAPPPTVVPRNEIERLVLARPESASRELEVWLANMQDKQGRHNALVEAGFRRVRIGDPCANYAYTRQLTSTLVRGASLILCDNEPPFVLRTDEAPGPWTAPKRGQPAVLVPSASK